MAGLLIHRAEYLKYGVHKGGFKKSKYMQRFILKTAPTGLNFFNLRKLDERIRIGANFLAKKENILILCNKEQKELYSKVGALINAKVIIKYPPGFLTNPNGKIFFEPEIVFIIDVKQFKNAIREISKEGLPIIAVCNTNTIPSNIDFVIPCNIKNKKGLFLVTYLLTKEILRLRGEGVLKIEDFNKVKAEDNLVSV